MKPFQRRAWVLAMAFMALLILGWRFYPPLSALFARPAPTVTLGHTFTNTSESQAPAPSAQVSLTDTEIPPTATASLTPSPIPTTTLTATFTATATATLPPSPTVMPTATIKYPNGYWMTAFYNENSFNIFNRGGASRSVAGFSFERIHADGTFQNYFGGWEWEKFFKVIQPNRCISLELYPTNLPYLRPAECENRVLSNLRFAPTGTTVFWTPNETSTQFRILWLNEEIARCEIAAGVCEFYVP